MERGLKDYALLMLKGVGMGAADVVPGVSGGTIAFIVGIYDELIDSIKSINGKSLKLFFTGKWGAFWKAINGNFLISIVAGIAVSVFSLAKVITWLLTDHTVMVWAFFFGLTIDVFADTPGMNAAATVLLAFLRPSLLRLFTPRDNLDSFIPSFKTIGITPFLKYTTASVFVHSLALLSIEFFSFSSIWLLLLRVLLCTILTVTCIVAVEGIRK